ncbi:hypothetical protein HNQ92_000419 [Rhabdobacter roseus]|uniref:Uncharacterized protein n=1 Tax=Rhabdobacter roseus TaxID=1655419 RepID=A0A840TQL7_9BACT|nr:hypothetical protein [Rhabdobacter roseus]MBB5282298.1 hypothetical protein [Rhabdobacter roseus]
MIVNFCNKYPGVSEKYLLVNDRFQRGKVKHFWLVKLHLTTSLRQETSGVFLPLVGRYLRVLAWLRLA